MMKSWFSFVRFVGWVISVMILIPNKGSTCYGSVFENTALTLVAAENQLQVVSAYTPSLLCFQRAEVMVAFQPLQSKTTNWIMGFGLPFWGVNQAVMAHKVVYDSFCMRQSLKFFFWKMWRMRSTFRSPVISVSDLLLLSRAVLHQWNQFLFCETWS